ncbi:PhzF family phenazine biosynthesis protein [Euzebya tangerina]|uniref:PhzF family phenazine biosynthesis protein n=1 Tax=Euzebya tangerina TaxID=591198 RepID=UPI000E3138A2|nr:PhzF family phenazine biosynthesis protein [Euzebya tangerina]
MNEVRLVDVFGSGGLSGNPVAVVHDADGLSAEQMLAFTQWMNLSECTFLVRPTADEADYHVRIFTPDREMAFAGHPTLGTCHAWLEAGGTPSTPGVVLQQCGAGLVPLDLDEGTISFAAPPLLREGPVDEADLDRVCAILRIDRTAVQAAAWTDNGPGWVTVQLQDAEAVLALDPRGDGDRIDIGVVGLYGDGGEADVEVRAFFTDAQGVLREDPVTGSLNASAGQWLIDRAELTPPFTAAQGTAMGRAGRVSVRLAADGSLLVGGRTTTILRGQLT